MAKYMVDYCCASTGYGWSREFDTIDEFEDLVNEVRQDRTRGIRVWDNQLKDFIFWKDCGTFTAYKDMLSDILRDLRTTTRRCKRKVV